MKICIALLILLSNFYFVVASNLNDQVQSFSGTGHDIRYFDLKEGNAEFLISFNNNYLDSTDISDFASISLTEVSGNNIPDGIFVENFMISHNQKHKIKIIFSEKYRLNIKLGDDTEWRVEIKNEIKEENKLVSFDFSPIIIGALILVFYFIPSYVARNRKNKQSIFLLNLLLGWTLLGWIGALIWAVNLPFERKKIIYVCSKCGFNYEIEQKIRLFVCSNCNSENIIKKTK